MEIDRLEVVIEAQASKANKQLDALCGRLSKLTSTLTGVNGSALVGLSNGVQRLGQAMSSIGNVRTSDFTRLANNIQKLCGINTASLNNLASSMSHITRALNMVSSVSSNVIQIGELAKNLAKFGNSNIQKAITNLPQLSTSLNSLITSLAQTPAVSTNLVQLITALGNINVRGIQRAATAVQNISNNASGAAKQTNVFASALNSLPGKTGTLTAKLKSLVSSIGSYIFKTGSATKQTRSLAQAFGSFYASCFLLIRGIKAIGNAIEKSMDYIETYNYFNVTMDKIGKEFSDQYAKYGYASADAYAESFSSRLNELTKKMTGFEVGSDGVLKITDEMNLGLDPDQLMNYQASVAAITNSVGLIGENSVNTSKALTMLAADMSSFKNIDLSTVMTNLQSGLIGQSRALYKYGIDITNATLQTYAYKYGLETAVSEMTQADKMQLRLLAILDQSKVAWGDQANTINSVANQYRILKQQVSNVARMIGNLLMPVIQAVLPAINGLLIALQRLLVFIGGLFGIDFSSIMDGISSGYSDGLEDLADDSEDLSNGLDDANSNAKKLQRTILGFDQINKLNDNNDSDSASGDGGVGGIDLSNEIAAALADYEAVWNKAFENSVNKAQEYADKISSIFSNMWRMIKAQDYEGLGKYIAGGVNYIFEQINSVFNWDNLGPRIKAFVDGYCRTVNSLASNIAWGKIGKSIGDGINLVTGTMYLYFTGIDWPSLGKSLSDGVEGILNSVKWNVLGRTIGSWLMKIPKLVYGFVSNLEWNEVGVALGNTINGILLEFDGKTIAGGINGLVNGILTSIKSAIKTIDWDEVAEAIGDVLGNLDWGTLTKIGLSVAAFKIVSSFGLLLKTAMGLAMKNSLANGIGAIMSSVGKGLSATVGKLFGGLSGGTFTGVVAGIAAVIAGIMDLWRTSERFRDNVSVMLSIIGQAFQDAKVRIWDNGLKPLWDKISELFGSLYELYEKSGLKTIFEAIVTGIGYIASIALAGLIEGIGFAVDFITGAVEVLIDIVDGFVDAMSWVCEKVGSFWDGICDFFDDAAKNIGNCWDDVVGFFDDAGRWIGDTFLSDWSDNFNAIGDAVVEFLDLSDDTASDVERVFSGLNQFVSGIFSGNWSQAWEGVKNTFSGVWNSIGNLIKKPVNGIMSICESLVNGIISGFNLIKRTLNNFHFDVPSWVPGIGGNSVGFNLDMTPRITLPRFENGGFPNTGEMFLARENGMPELVGRIGSQAAVANNDQIVTGIENGVKNAMSDVMADVVMAMSAQNSSGEIVNEVIVQVDSETAYRIVQKGKKKSDRRYYTVVPVG